MNDNDFNLESELSSLPDDILRHFVQNGLCKSCNNKATDHTVLDEVTEGWTSCWSESGYTPKEARASPHMQRYFCVRTSDHPERITRNEFEELYS